MARLIDAEQNKANWVWDLHNSQYIELTLLAEYTNVRLYH